MYKDELQERIEANQWSSEMLKSISILIQLESYDMGEIIAISRLLHGKIRDNQLPN